MPLVYSLYLDDSSPRFALQLLPTRERDMTLCPSVAVDLHGLLCTRQTYGRDLYTFLYANTLPVPPSFQHGLLAKKETVLSSDAHHIWYCCVSLTTPWSESYSCVLHRECCEGSLGYARARSARVARNIHFRVIRTWDGYAWFP